MDKSLTKLSEITFMLWYPSPGVMENFGQPITVVAPIVTLDVRVPRLRLGRPLEES